MHFGLIPVVFERNYPRSTTNFAPLLDQVAAVAPIYRTS